MPHRANTMSIALSEARGASLDDRCTELGEGGRADYEHQMVEWSASDQHTYADHIISGAFNTDIVLERMYGPGVAVCI